MAFQSPAHSNCNALQMVILTKILGKPKSRAAKVCEPEPLDAREMSELIKSFINLEHLKREIRGIPPLKPAEIGDVLKRARLKLGAAVSQNEPIEVDELPVVESPNASEGKG